MEGAFVNQGDSYGISTNQAVDQLDLPPGFRFNPTNEELIIHYLLPKVLDSNFTAAAIGEANLNRCEPWDLPSKEFRFFMSLCICFFLFYAEEYFIVCVLNFLYLYICGKNKISF